MHPVDFCSSARVDPADGQRQHRLTPIVHLRRSVSIPSLQIKCGRIDAVRMRCGCGADVVRIAGLGSGRDTAGDRHSSNFHMQMRPAAGGDGRGGILSGFFRDFTSIPVPWRILRESLKDLPRSYQQPSTFPSEILEDSLGFFIV